jgi:hypothetical protein
MLVLTVVVLSLMAVASGITAIVLRRKKPLEISGSEVPGREGSVADQSARRRAKGEIAGGVALLCLAALLVIAAQSVDLGG